MNTCPRFRARAPLYLSGEMDAEEREAFEMHLGQCSECAAKIAEDRNLDGMLRSALGGLPAGAGRGEQILRQKIAVARRRQQARSGAIAAAVALLAAGTLTWAYWIRPPSWYNDAALDHRAEVMEHQPRHWRSSDTELAGLAAQNGLSLEEISGIAGSGYRLERAKICGIAGRRMLHLVFFNGTRRYSIFVSPHLGPVETGRTIRRGTEEVAGFETGHIRGLVVSEGSAAECAELAQAAERRL